MIAPASPQTDRLRRTQQAYLRVKRVGDVVVAGAALVILAPVMIVISLAVLLTMGRPIIFTQQRTTRGDAVFLIRKFRTMHPPDGSRVSNTERLTAVGRWLRATSLDELPNLWNILRGDMSFIGPRPLTPDYLQRYSPEQRTRHRVRAGLTGLAQIHGRNALTWDAKLELDQRYVHLLGPVIDLRILIQTLPVVLARTGTAISDSATGSFPGPMRSPRLRLQEFPATSELAASTYEGEPVARCRMRPSPLDPTRLSLAVHFAGIEPTDLQPEAINLFLSRLRARGVEHVRVTSSHDESELTDVLQRLEIFQRRSRATGDTNQIQFEADIGTDPVPSTGARALPKDLQGAPR